MKQKKNEIQRRKKKSTNFMLSSDRTAVERCEQHVLMNLYISLNTFYSLGNFAECLLITQSLFPLIK